MEEPDGYITVLMRVKKKERVGDFKVAVAAEVINNLYFGADKLENNADRLSDLGIVTGSWISNGPIPLPEMPSKTRTAASEAPSNTRITSTTSIKKRSSVPLKSILQPLSSNRLVLLLFGILSIIRMPKPKKDLNASLTMFSNGFQPALVKILNQLDPISFINFATTCRRISTFVRSQRTGLKIEFPCQLVKMSQGMRIKWYKQGEGKRTITATQFANMKRFPFDFKIDVRFKYFQHNYIESVMNFVEQLNYYSLIALNIKDGSEHWNHTQSMISRRYWRLIASFVNKYSIKSLKYNGRLFSDACSMMIATCLERIDSFGPIHSRILIRAPQKVIVFEKSRLSTDDLKLLIQEFAKGKLDHVFFWNLCGLRNRNLIGNPEWIALFDGYETVARDHRGPLPTARPLVCHTDELCTVMLNENNRLIEFFLADGILIQHEILDLPEIFDEFDV